MGNGYLGAGRAACEGMTDAAYKVMTDAQLVGMYNAGKNDAAGVLFERHMGPLGVLRHGTSERLGANIRFEDLHSAATQGFFEALPEYNPKTDGDFKTYVLRRVSKAVRSEIAQAIAICGGSAPEMVPLHTLGAGSAFDGTGAGSEVDSISDAAWQRGQRVSFKGAGRGLRLVYRELERSL